jgi:hypothetical protein
LAITDTLASRDATLSVISWKPQGLHGPRSHRRERMMLIMVRQIRQLSRAVNAESGAQRGHTCYPLSRYRAFGCWRSRIRVRLAVMPASIRLNDEHTSIEPRDDAIRSFSKHWRELVCYFFDSMARS